METRAKDVANVGRDVANEVRDRAEDWAGQAKALGSAALEKAQAAYELAQNKAVAGAQATDKAIRKNPYQALGIAFGAGLLLGFLLKRD